MQMSPIKVFLALLGALAAITVVVLVTRPAATNTIPPSGATVSPDHSLTNAEAISRFKELKELRDRAYRERDVSLVPLIYTSAGRGRESVTKEIRSLLLDEVIDRTSFKTVNVSVVTNQPNEITLLQHAVVHPKFVTEDGKDITKTDDVQRNRVKWTLRLEESSWLVFDTLVVESRKVER